MTTIAIVGRPNVGKSTLFNRLLGRRKAITHDRPGVTRDRIHGTVRLADRKITLIDTGGLDFEETEGIEAGIMSQAREAVLAADIVLLVVDGREGLNPIDERVAELLRESESTTLLIVNKVDGPEKADILTAEFHTMGLELEPVSSEHGYNIQDLKERLAEMLPEEDESALQDVEHGLKLAIVGRPNVGKSSLINAMLRENRLIVSPEAGTTRDAVDVVFEARGRRYTFVDTAGVRKRGRIDDSLEKLSVVRALGTAKRADVAILMTDATMRLALQDKKLLSYLDREKIPFFVVINKADLLDKEALRDVKKIMQNELRICPHVPVVFTSTVTRKGLKDLLPMAEAIIQECGIRVGTGEINRALADMTSHHQPPLIKGRRAKFYYMTQSDVMPPTFVFFVNDQEKVKASYARYLENQLRKRFGIRIAPVRLYFRASRGKKE
ncbi:ribosome biogenesis GTPase Der [Desulfovibrio inopinatus]|uniref:ribosome biogenesis GTPase Der n=1 Tax=Desulfovibrio inopinatus TaxID=102109 RepID=UPI00041CBB69|nr:ribosome biogenesis GTPase Der [Desulfovibrio inopinatus]